MTLPAIRPMLPGDVDAATEMVLGHGWGVRREWLAFAATQDACLPLVAEADGAVVATGVGTASGAAGWVGSIFVDPAFRGHGLGRAMTQAIIDRLDDAGCRTLVLVATTEGRQLYERMGFDVQTHYRILEAPGLPALAPVAGGDGDDEVVRAFRAGDLATMTALDRAATGEDRSHALARLASPETARVLDTGAAEGLAGFIVRPPWGGGATIAASIEDALAIVAARRRSTGPEGRVRVGLLDENREGMARLAEVGFRQAWSAPRMVRGAALDWHPERIYGQFNHAMG
jgi:GNAT superfamily N-acetyltransferase